MASTFPTSLDAFTNPLSTDVLTSPSHAQQHSDINDAMEAVQTKLAIGNTVMGTYTAFTPGIGGFSLGNGTAVGQYCRVNDFVHVYGTITAGSTTTFPAGLWYTFPINHASAGFVPLGTCYTRDISTGQNYSGVVMALGSNAAYASIHSSDFPYIRFRTVESSTPMTWAAGDIHFFNLYYKAA